MESLQRIYGISFPDPKMLKEWEKFQEEAKNRDHRKLGRVSKRDSPPKEREIFPPKERFYTRGCSQTYKKGLSS